MLVRQSGCARLVRVKQADDKEKIAAGHAYLAPPGYHLLIDEDGFFALSTDPPEATTESGMPMFITQLMRS